MRLSTTLLRLSRVYFNVLTIMITLHVNPNTGNNQLLAKLKYALYTCIVSNDHTQLQLAIAVDI